VSQLKICPQCGAEYELDQRFCPKDGTTLRMQGSENDLVGSIIADRYHVLRKLGEGGMGQVYLAEHVKMGRKSAVKVMNPGMVHDADAISRFNREAANASRINHPNVAAVYDFGETGEGLIYLAMEFVEGPPLTSLIEQQGALPPLRAADIARQTADALTVAHDMGIVHRDLKPDNIMVARNRDGSDLVKVVDFGIAKAADNEKQKVTKTGLVVGTPEYMSPEQLAGDKLDGRSDIYSLGLVAFNMLTGKLPFPSESAQEAMIMRLTDKPKPLAEMKPDVAWTPEVQAVMDKVLERDANLRYQTAAQFGRDLLRAVEAMPQSVAAAAGTQVIGAPSVAAAAAGATAAIPATRVAGAADAVVKQAPAPTPAGKSKTPLIAAIVTVVVLGGGTTAVWMMRGSPAKATPANPPATMADSTVGGAGGAVRKPEETKKGAAAPVGGTEKLSKPLATNPTGTSPAVKTPPANSQTAAVNVDAELNRIDALANDENTADQALQALDQLEKQALNRMSADQVAAADLYKAFALMSKNDTAGACKAAKNGYAIVSDSKLKRKLEPIATHCP